MSRMDRYSEQHSKNLNRTNRNSELYNKIYADKNYDSIETYSVNVGKEIDIRDVKEMLKKRELYGEVKDYRIVKPREEVSRRVKYQDVVSEGNHDINEMIGKAKEERPDELRRRHLDDTQVLTLQELVSKKQYAKKTKLDKEEMKDLINTIYDTNLISSDNEQGLLDSLKSTGKTVVSPDIKKVLDEAKKDDTTEMDKSFFTSSLGFKDKDLERINSYDEVDDSNEKTNRFLFILGTVFIVLVLFILIKFALL